jgi:hypothetical protein
MKEVMTAVNLKPINVQALRVTIESTSPMIQHQWSEKAKRAMREKGAGKKTKERSARDPEGEAKSATYFTAKGEYGVPLLAVKSATIEAAHKDLGIEKTLVRKALFIKAPDATMVLPIKTSKPKVREDMVRVGMGSADLRYRPQFDSWTAVLEIDYDADLLQPADIVNLIDRAGFGVGICEWRPEKGGEFGRFRVKR